MYYLARFSNISELQTVSDNESHIRNYEKEKYE